MRIQTARFGSPIELANTTYTTLDVRVVKYGVKSMDYESGVLNIVLNNGRNFIVFPTNIAFLEPLPEIKQEKESKK